MNTLKKLTALLLALVMVLALAACGTTEKTDDSAAADEAAEAETEEAADTEEAEADAEPAEVFYGIEPYEGETPTLTWYCVNTGSDITDEDAVMEELNKLLLERYNIQVNMIIYDYGEYDEKLNLIINSNEQFDLCYCSEGWICKYNDQCEKGAFLALDDLIDEYEPTLWDVLPEGKWDATRYSDGLIYAVPNTQKCFSGSAICIQKTYADEYGLDIEGLQGLDENGIRELYDFFDWCIENYPDMYVTDLGGFTYNNACGYYNYVNRDRQYEALNKCMLDTETNTVVSGWDLFVEEATIRHEMYKAGYIRSDIAAINDNTADIKSDKYICRSSVYKPGQEAEYTASGGGAEWYMIRIGEPIVTKEAVRSTMTAISQNCANPAAALKLMNILYNDPEVVSLINYGIEGTHYNINDEGLVEQIADSGYFYNQGWATGLQFLLTPTVGNAATLWEETQEVENAAICESIMSFTPNYEDLSVELAQIKSVEEEHTSDYLLDDAEFEAALEAEKAELESAGLSTVISTLQAQVDEWAK